MLQLKAGVVLVGNVYTNTILDAVQRAFARHAVDLIVITEGLGNHATGYHPQGRALDIRFWGIKPEKREAVAQTIRDFLPAYYDVVVEVDHYHIEADAKKELKNAA